MTGETAATSLNSRLAHTNGVRKIIKPYKWELLNKLCNKKG